MKNIINWALVGAMVSIVSASPDVHAQTKEQVKQQAEQKLQQMTPQQVEAKLKEIGIPRWEAIRRAQDLGITLENYLSGSVQIQPSSTEPVSTPTDVVQPSIARPTGTGPAETPPVPGFAGRMGIGTDIKPFGYDIFTYPSSTFEPVLNIATPPSYLLGPGDEIIVSVWGETKLYYQLSVNREGNINVPEVGPVGANGLTIQQFREKLLRRLTEVYSRLRGGAKGADTFLDVSLGKLHTVQVFVLGEVKKPGGYSLSSMSTVLHALYLSGGPTVNGSLRDVRLQRDRGTYSVIDLYDYIIRGDNSKDTRLQDGDIVFLRPVGKRVALIGHVVRPAIYELKGMEKLGDLIALAGGPRFDAYYQRLHVERVIPFDLRERFTKDILDIDVTFGSMGELEKSKFDLVDGDIATVFKITDFYENRVTIAGNVRKAGVYELKQDWTIRDLILEADSLVGTTFQRGLLYRLLPNQRREVIPFNPMLAVQGDKDHNLFLESEDEVFVFPESRFLPTPRVAIAGAVRNSNYYTRHENMTLQDLVMTAGGLREDAELTGWEISRLDTTKVGVYTKIIKLSYPFNYWEDSIKAFILQDFDYVFVPSNPRFQVQKFIDLQGYVMYPGPYPIRYGGERLLDVIQRAGGLRPGAYLEGSKIFRRGAIGDKIQVGQVPIDFRKALDDPTSRDNIVLYERDSIYISYLEDVVRVTGEVFVPSAILYKRGSTLKYYLQQAGGLKEEADDDRIYVLLPGGKKWESGVFGSQEILPGSAVYVPRKIEKEDKTLPIIRDLATILASLAAITVALVQVTR